MDSVRKQSYPYWELCVADDASVNSALKAYLEKLRDEDARVRVIFRSSNGHICHNTNSALSLATGDWIAFLDHDDLITPDALAEFVVFAQDKDLRGDGLNFIYSDEDKIDVCGRYSEPARKPDWQPAKLFETMYTGHFAFYSRALIDKVCGLRPGFEGAQDWDLLLRASEAEGFRAFHLPKILYHWRKHSLSTAVAPLSKPYAHQASHRALLDAFHRRGLTMFLDGCPGPGFYRWTRVAEENFKKLFLASPTLSQQCAAYAQKRLARLKVPGDLSKTPIIINNFNRLTYLKEQLASFEARGFTNIIILDNGSTFSPLLDFYKKSSVEVIYLEQNIGHLALWQTRIFNRFRNQFYVYTDPDVIIDPACPPDFLAKLYEMLLRYPSLDKIGLGLRVDDLPASNPFKLQIQNHEASLRGAPLRDGFYAAPVDTTFALYRPGARGGYWLNAARSSAPYQALHRPWYEDPAMQDDERAHYLKHATRSTHWSELDRQKS